MERLIHTTEGELKAVRDFNTIGNQCHLTKEGLAHYNKMPWTYVITERCQVAVVPEDHVAVDLYRKDVGEDLRIFDKRFLVPGAHDPEL